MKNRQLEKKAAEVRLQVLQTALHAGKGHVPPAFSWVEIGIALFYGNVLNQKPSNPKWADRDRFILSKGHGCLTLYSILADLGYFQKSELDTFDGDGSLLGGHPDIAIPGIEALSGSLGHGLGISAGLALAAKIDHHKWKVFTVLGDGECEEGSVWEAAMFASHHKLDNLIAIIDRNKLSATDFTDNYTSLEPFHLRWQAFGWDVVTVNGHSFNQLIETLLQAKTRSTAKPLVIIAETTKGKGVSFMENSSSWHHQLPKGEQATCALGELKENLKRINGDCSSAEGM
ncbi:MAG: transketolase [Methanoregula sp.]